MVAAWSFGAASPALRADPVQLRIASVLGAAPLGTVRTPAGLALTDGGRVVTFLAAWNDDVIARALGLGDAPSTRLTVRAAAPSNDGWLGIKWIYWAGAAGVAAGAAAGLGSAKLWVDHHAKRRAEEAAEELEDDDAFVLVPADDAPRLLADHAAAQADEDEGEEGDQDADEDDTADASEAPLLLPNSL